MEFSYTVIGDRVRIDKVEYPQKNVVIPEQIEGYPVTELGAYVLAGSDVEELWLPGDLKRIGAYGFYNCEKLRRIHCTSRTTDLGTGLFAGAGNVDFMDILIFDGEKSCLKELLSELRQTLRVRIRLCRPEDDRRSGERKEARLIFPEYYEESVENTPARILYIETHGCGHRYRYCFAGTQFRYLQYDELFSHVKVQEQETLVTELALGRLMYPLGLLEKYEKMYQEYVSEHWQTAGKLLIEADRQGGNGSGNLEAGGIPWLVEHVLSEQRAAGEIATGQGPAGQMVVGQRAVGQQVAGQRAARQDGKIGEQIKELTIMAQQAGDTEMVSWLMDFRSRHEKKAGKRRFEL